MADDTYTIERSAVVAAAPERVYDEIADFRNWTHWSPWEEVDPDLRRDYSGAESGTGAVYRWSGNRKAGQGRMEIIETRTPSYVGVDLRFEKPFKAQNDTSFTITPVGEGTRITWTMTGRKTLATKMMSMFKSMDSMVGPDFEKGLSRLKATVER